MQLEVRIVIFWGEGWSVKKASWVLIMFGFLIWVLLHGCTQSKIHPNSTFVCNIHFVIHIMCQFKKAKKMTTVDITMEVSLLTHCVR